MFHACGQKIDAGGFDAGMAQYIGQPCDVLAGFVENPGEQVAQIMGIDLPGVYSRRPAQGFHLRPNLASAHALSASGDEDFTGGGFIFPGVFQQLAAELPRQKYGAYLAL